MVIDSYKVNNVLRVYGDQLRQSKAVRKTGECSEPSTDRVDAPGGAKRRALIERIAATIVDRILQEGPRDDMEKEVFQKLQEEDGESLAVSPESLKGLLFRVIDGKGESLHSLSIEDADFLTQKLKEITTETVDKNLFSTRRPSNENG
jgi:hypothetical protein